MSRRDYKLWRFIKPDGTWFAADLKSSPKIGTRLKDITGTMWVIWYIEEGRGVRNARLEPAEVHVP